MYYLFISFFVFFIPVAGGADPVTKNVFSEAVVVQNLPAGTRMMIPLAIMREYQSVAEEWGHPFNYLSHHYSSLGPSTLNKGGDTYYIPLSREDGKSITQKSGIVMVDLMNLEMSKGDTIFTIIKDSYIINRKNVFIAVVDVAAWNQIFHKPAVVVSQ